MKQYILYQITSSQNWCIPIAKVDEVEKSIKYFFVYEFCSKLAATGKSGMVYVISVSRCSNNLNLGNSFLLKKQLLKLRTKCSNSAMLVLQKFGPIYVQLSMCSGRRCTNRNIFEFQKCNTTIGAKQPKSYKTYVCEV